MSMSTEPSDYACREYGATPAELENFEKRTLVHIEQARAQNKLHTYTGDLEAMLTGAGLREYFKNGGSGVSEQYLDAIEAAIQHDPIPDDPDA